MGPSAPGPFNRFKARSLLGLFTDVQYARTYALSAEEEDGAPRRAVAALVAEEEDPAAVFRLLATCSE